MQLTQFLDQLDFNRYEKEAIVFLTGVDRADAKAIYKGTKIPKGRIYSVLGNLREKNILQAIPTKPKQYTIENVRAALQEHLHDKRIALKEQALKIPLLELREKVFSEANAPSVSLFTGREEHLQALISLRSRARRRLLQVAPLFAGTFASNLSLHKATQRGIAVRVITKKVTPENKRNIQECLRLGAEVRILDAPDLIYFLIKDADEFLLGIENHLNKEERLSFAGKSKGLLLVLEEYFEKLWKEAKGV